MSTPDWGIEEPEAHFDTHPDLPHPAPTTLTAPAAASLAAQREAARTHGFEPAPTTPLWCFLPAVWPRAHRAWLGDPDAAHRDAGVADLLAGLGLPTGPPGRAWLLRSPEPDRTVAALLDDLWQEWLDAGGTAQLSAAFVAHVERLMQTE
ncbi:hypothetical protein [Nocardioides sp.]|uniref:hypothetical protein n=1 Tax=Nocardioides sp. TaxID=35761 RepID=UPI003514632F